MKKSPPSKLSKNRQTSIDAKAFLEESLKALEDGPVNAKGVTLYSDVANDEPDAPVVFSGEAELQMRRLVEILGLERMPFTMAEYAGVLDYWSWFEDAKSEAIVNIKPDAQFTAALYENNLRFTEERRPDWAKPLRLFLQSDQQALKAYHQALPFVEYLGKWWVWSEKREDAIRDDLPFDEGSRPRP